MELTRLSVSNPVFDMEGNTAAYLLVDDRVVLIDTGVGTPRTRTELVDGLAAAGMSPADVDHLLLTHWHPDHAGLAGVVQAAGEATVHVHEADAEIVAGAGAGLDELSDTRMATLQDWGLPAPVREAVANRVSDGEGPRGFADERPSVTSLTDGDRIPLGDHAIRAIHTPGHTAGETCFVLERTDRSVVFTGDALLPDYTANVGGADPRATEALSAHLESLQLLAGRGDDRGYPGHGEPMTDPAARARTVLSHHRERARTLLVATSEPTTVWDAAAELFGELTEVHLMLGLGETYAHLEHLRRADLVERTGEGYVTVDADQAALAAAFPEGHA